MNNCLRYVFLLQESMGWRVRAMRTPLNVFTFRSNHFKMIMLSATGWHTLGQLIVLDVAPRTKSQVPVGLLAPDQQNLPAEQLIFPFPVRTSSFRLSVQSAKVHENNTEVQCCNLRNLMTKQPDSVPLFNLQSHYSVV